MAEVAWAAGLQALSLYYVGGATLQATLDRVAELAVEAVPGADLVGITMIVEGQERTAVFTDPVVLEIDQAQYDTGDGPCLDAFATAEVFRIDDTAASGPWPTFRRTALDHGIRSTLSMPLLVEERSVGALNTYSRELAAFTDEVAAAAEPFVAQAAIALANAQVYWDAKQLGARLSEAIEFRSVIEQAKGILMGAQHCDADAAHGLLVAASQRENVKVRAIAQRIVDRASNGHEPGTP